MHPRPTLDPSTLASLLDRWALRREKVLELLDIRAATRARDLAVACKEFSVWRERTDVTDDDAHLVWLELRHRALKVLEEAQRSWTPSARSPAALGRSSAVLERSSAVLERSSAVLERSSAAPSERSRAARTSLRSAPSGTRRAHREADLEVDPRHESDWVAPTPRAVRGR